MKRIAYNGMGWYKVYTGRNFKETAAKKWLKNNFNKNQAVKSLIAQHNSVEAAKFIVNGILNATNHKYSIIAMRGYIIVKCCSLL